MLKKVTVLVVTCVIGLCFSNENAQAQEGGAEESAEVIIGSDSTGTQIPVDSEKLEPVNQAFGNSADEVISERPVLIKREVPKLLVVPNNSSEKTKAKDGKSDVSFNIFYYLFYKFKHVDGN